MKNRTSAAVCAVMRSACPVLVAIVWGFYGFAAELVGLRYDTGTVSRATGFFRIEQGADGVWRFVTPGGHGFFMAANNGPSHMGGDFCPALGYSPYTRTLEAKYGKDRAQWARDVSNRLLAWNFNTVSTWGEPVKGIVGNGLAGARVIQMGKSFARSVPNNESNLINNVEFKGAFPNVFHPDFVVHCRRLAEKFCAKDRDNPWIVGWYTDNEITWRGAKRQDVDDASDGTGMYDAVVKLPKGHSGRVALDRFLAARGLSATNGVSAAVKRDFMRLVAREYYRITTSAIRAVAPNHLVLGCRFAGFRGVPAVVWEEGGRWNDAMSVNTYPPSDRTNGFVFTGWRDRRPLIAKLRDVYALARKPLIVTEWSYPAKDTPCPNRVGAGERVPTQKIRAEASELFVKTLLGEPEVVGHVHFRWVDEPVQGRWKMTGGEDCNYGLVNEQDEAYGPLTEMFTRLHGDMYAVRATIGTANPPVRPLSTIPYPKFHTYSKARGGCWWKPRHEAKLAEIARLGGTCDLVLIGDSITHYWEEKAYAAASWASLTNRCRTLNLGFAGDKTENVIWRLDNGELDGFRAKAVVLMIGTNNSTRDTTTPWETALGVKAILDSIRARQPKAKILLTAIFPRGRGVDDARHANAKVRNDRTNAILKTFADGASVAWVDVNGRLCDPATGWTTPDLFPDRIHPSDAGYRAWMEEILRKMKEVSSSSFPHAELSR